MVKLDLACGRKLEPVLDAEGKPTGAMQEARPEFIGVDAYQASEHVDIILDLRVTPWPWADGEVEEVFCSHFVEHLDGTERIAFFNELYRVMAPGAKATVITPHWSNACAYGDPTHKWPPMSEWAWFYLNKKWREDNAPYVTYTCDFDTNAQPTHDGRLNGRNIEYLHFAFNNYINNWRDMVTTLVKK